MFIGHGLVAFAIVAGLALLAGWDGERAFAVGLLAGAFGLAPDVDILYAPIGLIGASGLLEAEAGFWAAGNVVHRGMTHSLLVGGAAAAVGLLSHPFGDLFTGGPPAFLYPLDGTLVAERVVLHPDPTLHLLAVFGLEVATMWAAAVVYLHTTDRRMADYVSPHATLGVGFAVAALVLPSPTLESPYRFVFGALGIGMVSGVSRPRQWRAVVSRPAAAERLTALDAALTALATLTTALVAYGTLYLLL